MKLVAVFLILAFATMAQSEQREDACFFKEEPSTPRAKPEGPSEIRRFTRQFT